MKTKLFSVAVLLGSLLNAQTYSNGPLSTGATTSGGAAAPSGYTWSELQSGNTSLGAAGYKSATADFRLADDFTVPANESWAISSIDVFAYQTGSTTMPFNQMSLQILDRDPGAGVAIFGDTTTNILNLAGTTDSFIYRTSNTAGTTRRIWKLKGNVSKSLTPGTYWVDYQVHATNDGAAFLPLTTAVGVISPPNANAKQFNAEWLALQDGGSLTNQELPFVITYVATSLGTTEIRQYDNRVVVYPNPTTEFFKLDLPQESVGAKTSVSIYDAAGKMVRTYKVSDTYNVADLAKGVYLIKVNDGTNLKATKLIKK